MISYLKEFINIPLRILRYCRDSYNDIKYVIESNNQYRNNQYSIFSVGFLKVLFVPLFQLSTAWGSKCQFYVMFTYCNKYYEMFFYSIFTFNAFLNICFWCLTNSKNVSLFSKAVIQGFCNTGFSKLYIFKYITQMLVIYLK